MSRLGSVGVLGRDRGGEGVGQLLDLFEEVGEDALGFGAPADRGELRGDGAEVVEYAADLNQAIVQLVHRLGILVGTFVVVLVDVVIVVEGGRAGGRRCVVICRGCAERGWCETSCVNPWCG
jgi:hypothetical protein